MNRRQHEDVARTWFSALGRGDTETMAGISTDDMTWWIVPGNKFSGTHTKEQFLGNLSTLFTDASGPLTLEYREITGEGDRLAIVAKGDMPMRDGRRYQSNYHFLLHFRDGKIASGKEFLDTIHVNEILRGQDDASNVAIMKRYLAANERGDRAEMAGLLAEDATYWIVPGTTFSGTFDKPAFLKLADHLVEARSAPLELSYEAITAQGDRVAAVVRGHMPIKTGGAYDNIYHWLFTFRDGKIVNVREFFDATAVRKAFGAGEERKAA